MKMILIQMLDSLARYCAVWNPICNGKQPLY